MALYNHGLGLQRPDKMARRDQNNESPVNSSSNPAPSALRQQSGEGTKPTRCSITVTEGVRRHLAPYAAFRTSCKALRVATERYTSRPTRHKQPRDMTASCSGDFGSLPEISEPKSWAVLPIATNTLELKSSTQNRETMYT
mmetsp:Transcript_104440/g.265095  ORF Transcript_104440/g.265095 Transcript_104440/m.265095 type:complete len:141 (+) Transcript_104440:118-540(+)